MSDEVLAVIVTCFVTVCLAMAAFGFMENRQNQSVDHQCCPCVEQDPSSLDLWQDIWVVL